MQISFHSTFQHSISRSIFKIKTFIVRRTFHCVFAISWWPCALYNIAFTEYTLQPTSNSITELNKPWFWYCFT